MQQFSNTFKKFSREQFYSSRKCQSFETLKVSKSNRNDLPKLKSKKGDFSKYKKMKA